MYSSTSLLVAAFCPRQAKVSSEFPALEIEADATYPVLHARSCHAILELARVIEAMADQRYLSLLFSTRPSQNISTI